MKTLIFALLLLCPSVHAADLDFNFMIEGDRFHLEIKQEFKVPIAELRKKFTPDFLPQISKVVTSAKSTIIDELVSKITLTGRKHGLSSTLVGTCTEKNEPSEWTMLCNLNLDDEDTGDYFNSGSETIHCTSTESSSTCTFTVDASVKSQRRLIFYRSAEVLALGGIVERLHDQAVLGRVVNLNETPKVAFQKFEDSNLGTCLDQIYSTYEGRAQRMAFSNTALAVRSSLWRCSP